MLLQMVSQKQCTQAVYNNTKFENQQACCITKTNKTKKNQKGTTTVKRFVKSSVKSLQKSDKAVYNVMKRL